MTLPEIMRCYFETIYMMWGFKRFLGVLEYIYKNKIIIQFELLKMRADLNLVSI